MPTNDRVQVVFKLDGQPAPELADPESPDSESIITKYIEVKAGQFWTVDITMLKDFYLGFAPQLFVNLVVDNQNTRDYQNMLCGGLKHKRGHLQEPLGLCSFAGRKLWDDDNGRWAIHKYQIGALGLVEGGELPQGMGPQELSKVGTIRLTFYRAKPVLKSQPYMFDGRATEVLHEIPEKAAKGAAIKANTKFTVDQPTTAPDPVLYDWEPIAGPYGKVYEFFFKYRSRKALQNLGILERSPSPAPDLALQLERTQADNEEIRRELKQLRAELRSSSVASSTTIKRETGTDSPRPYFHPNDMKRKREIDDDDGEIIEIAPPPKKPRVVVDLTGDD